jgi:hypothetical protein
MNHHARIDKTDNQTCELKRKKLDKYRMIFKSVVDSMSPIQLDFDKNLRTPNKGQFECTIGSLTFNNINTFDNLLKTLPAVHTKFAIECNLKPL